MAVNGFLATRNMPRAADTRSHLTQINSALKRSAPVTKKLLVAQYTTDDSYTVCLLVLKDLEKAHIPLTLKI